MSQGNDSTFDEWAILELMGHRRLAGKVTEQEIGGANMIRIDVYRAKPESRPSLTARSRTSRS